MTDPKTIRVELPPTGGMAIPYYLTTAVEEAFSPDPYLSIPDPNTVVAVAALIWGMAQVSKGRRPSLACEPWRSKSSSLHFDHARAHTEEALVSVEARELKRYFDRETGLPNPYHAGLRLAFGAIRRIEEFGPR